MASRRQEAHWLIFMVPGIESPKNLFQPFLDPFLISKVKKKIKSIFYICCITLLFHGDLDLVSFSHEKYSTTRDPINSKSIFTSQITKQNEQQFMLNTKWTLQQTFGQPCSTAMLAAIIMLLKWGQPWCLHPTLCLVLINYLKDTWWIWEAECSDRIKLTSLQAGRWINPTEHDSRRKIFCDLCHISVYISWTRPRSEWVQQIRFHVWHPNHWRHMWGYVTSACCTTVGKATNCKSGWCIFPS